MLLPIAPEALPALLALNNAHATELSELTLERLGAMLAEAFHARATAAADGFLIAFDEGAAYDSPNFLWLQQRFQRFVYIDRVAIAAAARGRGLARRLYEDLFAQAALAGHNRVVCEINLVPANLASDAFHARLGFAEIGQATIHGGSKTVRYLSRPIAQR